jgi:RNA-directed DNA polymerase
LNKKTHIYPLSHGLKFLKWRFILTDTGKVVRLMSKKSISKERRKLKSKMDNGLITIQDVRNNYQSWVANARRGNTRALILRMNTYYQELFGEVPK